MGRNKKQKVEAATPLPVQEGVNDGLRNEEKEKEQGQVVLVKMYRSNKYPEPHTANCHPNEIKNFAIDGWVVLEE